MKNSLFIFSLLSCTVLFRQDIVIASDISTHTHTDTPGLKPASFIDMAHSYKTAAVCFMGYGDCDRNQKYNKGDDYSRDSETMCKEEGYLKTSCTIPEYLYNPCPYDSRFYKECRRDINKACTDAGYSKSCSTGYVPDASQPCPYDSFYKKCKCDPCDGYDYTYAQATASGYTADTSCNRCGTIKYKRQPAACTGYKSCECGGEIGASSCKSGTNTLYKSCKSCCTPSSCTGYDLYTCPTGSNCEICDRGCNAGIKYRFSNCQNGYYLSGGSCTKCGTKTQCPTGESLVNICKINGISQGDCANCRDENSSFNPCKGYFICDSSKVGDGKTCDCGGITYYERCLVPETCNDDSGNYNGIYHAAHSESYLSSVSSGIYKVAEKCTRQDGTKIFWTQICTSSSLNGNGNYAPCKGKIDCGKETGTGACSCGGKTFYDKGSCCNDDSGNYNGIYHAAHSESYLSSVSSGIYKVAEKCTRQDGTKIFWTQICTSSSLNGNGNYAPCKGKIDCGKDYAVGEICSCGGKTYGTACATTCNYEETPESCGSKGKSFSFKCGSSEGLQYGVCE